MVVLVREQRGQAQHHNPTAIWQNKQCFIGCDVNARRTTVQICRRHERRAGVNTNLRDGQITRLRLDEVCLTVDQPAADMPLFVGRRAPQCQKHPCPVCRLPHPANQGSRISLFTVACARTSLW